MFQIPIQLDPYFNDGSTGYGSVYSRPIRTVYICGARYSYLKVPKHENFLSRVFLVKTLLPGQEVSTIKKK